MTSPAFVPLVIKEELELQQSGGCFSQGTKTLIESLCQQDASQTCEKACGSKEFTIHLAHGRQAGEHQLGTWETQRGQGQLGDMRQATASV